MRYRPPRALLIAIAPLIVAVPLASGSLHGSARAQSTQGLHTNTTVAVTIQNFAFSPMTVTVNPGTTVQWTNLDGVAHTVTADNGSFTSGNINTNGTYSHTFTSAGTITYHCAIHPFMHGGVVVPAPTLTRSRVSGGWKDTVTITGTNFFSNEGINLYFDVTNTAPLSTTTSNSAGTFVDTFIVPQAISGTHTLIVVGQTSKIKATTGFLIRPKTFLKHYQGSAGSSNQITGTGYAAHETITAHWNASNGPVLGTSSTSSIGTFGGTGGVTGITFTVPMSPTGTYKVYAVGQSSGGVAFSTFTLK